MATYRVIFNGELYHHGVPGQKWGVRNGPPYPLSDNPSNLEVDDVKSVLSTLSKKERQHVIGNRSYTDSKYSVYRKVIKVKGKPAGFIEAFKDPDLNQNEAIVISAVAKQFRGQKLSSKMAKDLVKNLPKGIDTLYWETTKDNPASAKAALAAGFKKSSDYNKDDDNYIYTKRSSKDLTTDISAKAKKIEPVLTKDIKNAARLAGSKMYGLEHRLKTDESISRKIKTDSTEKKISEFDAASDIKDAVRYTTISPDDRFVSSYKIVKGSLEDKGYKEVRCKNYWDLYEKGQVKHKSVQSVFESPDGYKFEVQFQTPSSQAAKNKKVPLYEERRSLGVSKQRAEELERQMEALAESVSTPKDIHKIKTH